MYYTQSYEWVDFQGIVAYVGMSNFKFLGVAEVKRIKFCEVGCFKRTGETIVELTHTEGDIVMSMPVDGEVIGINEVMLWGHEAKIMQHLGKSGWIIKISPSNPSERSHLIPVEEYQLLK